jgi:uncharacterized protein (TIGR02466 family)
MNINEEIMFFSPAYCTILEDINNEKIIEESYFFQKKFTSVKKSNFGGWQSPSDWQHKDLKDTEISNLLSNIQEMANHIFKVWEIEAKLDNFWININKKHNFNKIHSHPGCVFSGVFYVKCNEKSGNIIFERPDNQGFCIDDSKTNPHRFGTYFFQPQNKMAIVFPSHLKHYVEPNMSDEDRISIAFNFS